MKQNDEHQGEGFCWRLSLVSGQSYISFIQETFWQLLTPSPSNHAISVQTEIRFHGYGKASLLIADNNLMCGCIWVCLMICTKHLCPCSRMTPDLILCVHVYSLVGLYSHIVKWLVTGPVLLCYHTHSKLRPHFLLVSLATSMGGGLINEYG